MEIYLPDNPIELTALAFSNMGLFEEEQFGMESQFIAIGSNGYTPESLSLGGAVIWAEYESLEMYDYTSRDNGTLLYTNLTDINAYYRSHIDFLNAFVTGGVHGIINFILPRCIVNLELFPINYVVQTEFKTIQKEFCHANAIESISTYLTYYLRDMSTSIIEGMDGLISRLVWFDQFYKEYLMYVPSKLA